MPKRKKGSRAKNKKKQRKFNGHSVQEFYFQHREILQNKQTMDREWFVQHWKNKKEEEV